MRSKLSYYSSYYIHELLYFWITVNLHFPIVHLNLKIFQIAEYKSDEYNMMKYNGDMTNTIFRSNLKY